MALTKEPNRFLIRHGYEKPTTANLEPFELGYSEKNKLLYIRHGNQIIDPGWDRYNDLTGKHNTLATEVHGTDGNGGLKKGLSDLSNNFSTLVKDGGRISVLEQNYNTLVNTTIPTLNGRVETLETNIKKTIPQVGEIYITTENYTEYGINSLFSAIVPGIKFERYGQGRTLVGYDPSDTDFSHKKTGGSKTVTLTENEVPAHTHGGATKDLTGSFWNWVGQDSNYHNNTSGIFDSVQKDPTVPIPIHGCTWVNGKDGLYIDVAHTHSSFGGGQAHSNLQPYITVYMWRRTA